MLRRKDYHCSFLPIQYLPYHRVKHEFQEQITPIDHSSAHRCLNFLGFDLMAAHTSLRGRSISAD